MEKLYQDNHVIILSKVVNHGKETHLALESQI